MTSPSSRRVALSRAVALTGLLGCLVSLHAQELADIVPPDAYMYSHVRSDPAAAVINGYYAELGEAVLAARFDESLLQVVDALGTEDEAANARALRDYAAHLLGGVPWGELVKNEFVYAEMLRLPASDGWGSMPSFGVMAGFRVDDDVRAQVHRGLRDLMVAGAGFLQGNMSLELVVDDGSGVLSTLAPSDFTSEMPRFEDAATFTYNIAVYDDGRRVPLFQAGFQDEFVVIGLNPGGRGPVGPALESLRGEGGKSLRDTKRFKRAFDGQPGASEIVYVDFPNLFTPMQQMSMALVPILVQELMGSVDRGQAAKMGALAGGLTNDVWDLFDDYESVAVRTQVDGLRRVSDTRFRMTPGPGARANPICTMQLAGAEAGSELIEFVPHDATSFSVNGGYDLVPLYRWAEDRVRAYVPDAEKWLGVIDAAEAVVGVDIEQDLLGIMGAGMVTMTLPARRPTAMQPSDSVTILKARDPQRMRAMYGRLDTIIGAVQFFWDDMMSEVRSSMSGNPSFATFDMSLQNAEAPYSNLRRLDVQHMFGKTSIYFGLVGAMYVTSTSPEALTYVLETVAGEHANVTEEHDRMDPSFLPDDPIFAASFRSYEDVPGVLLQALGAAQGGLSAVSMTVGHELGDREREALGVVQSILPKITEIVQHYDFVDHKASWEQVRDEGFTYVRRDVTYYKAPEERGLR